MTRTINARCEDCGFASTDVHLVLNHSCDIEEFGGRCEDYPCCGHEAGDCNGRLYGSSELIRNDPHLLCDHATGNCDVWEYEED